MNKLTDLPFEWRNRIYPVLAVIGLLIPAIFAGLAAAAIAPPAWLVFIAAFYGALAGPGFVVAKAHITY